MGHIRQFPVLYLEQCWDAKSVAAYRGTITECRAITYGVQSSEWSAEVCCERVYLVVLTPGESTEELID